ncbi:MAG: S41 family peptidase [Mucilaginibacter sp.]
MKKMLVLTLTVLGLLMNITALKAQNNKQTQHLATFAKMWGFLKYYHPAAAKGTTDWDKEFFRMVPLVKSAGGDKGFDKLLTDWYSSLPKAGLSPAITQMQSDTILWIFTEKDIARFGVSAPLKTALTKLYLHHIPDSNKFIDNRYNGHKLDYIYHKENPYALPAYPDEVHRLLALARYWNIINYFYPDKYINAKNWESVLPEFIPQFIAASDSNEYRKTFLRLTAQINDSHSFFNQKEWNNAHQTLNLPFTTVYINGKFVIGRSRYDSLMKELDFRIGDEIVSINNKPVAERVKELKPYTTGTNELSMYRNIASTLFKIDTVRILRLGIKRHGKNINKTVKLFTEGELWNYRKNHPLNLWEDFGNGVWYVRICEITKPDTLKRLFTDLQKAKVVIWEMRAYPNFKVMQQVSAGLFPAVNRTNIDYNGILEFPGSFAKHISNGFDKINSLKLPLYTGKMIVLVNEETQSLAESVAAELRSRPNTIIMGRQTAGTTGNILWVDYPGGIEASFTGVGVEGVNDSFREGRGVKIDKEIKLNAKDLDKYPDYMLEMAYREAVGLL